MKWIKSRQKFLNEAKLREVIFPKQATTVSKTWGEKYLDYEEVKPTDKIIQGKWKLTEEDKMKVLGAFFQCNMQNVFDAFKDLPDRFCHVLAQSLNAEITPEPEKYKVVMKEFNPKEPSIDQIVAIYDNIFRKLNVSETAADSMIQKDENGRPVRDEKGQMIKVAKEKGDPIFTNNLINITTFCDDYNRCYPDEKVESSRFANSDIRSLRNLAKEDCNGKLRVDFEIFNRDLYLSISHNPKDILNMSISKFYNSCQNLYDGGYREQVLGNVFDPNSIPAFLTFDTPIFWNEEKVSEQLPLSRTIIRHIEGFDQSSKGLLFDRTYPDRLEKVFKEIIPTYSGNKQTLSERDSITYVFTPDIGLTDDRIRDPYMDRVSIKRVPMVGVNCKSLYLSRVGDWSNIKIAPDSKIKELIIETTSIPENLFNLKLELDWIKFKYLQLNTLEPFEKLMTDSIAFDKCKFRAEAIMARKDSLKKLQIISCDANGLDFSQFSKLEELHLVYTLNDSSELKQSLVNTKLKKLVISGDLASSKEEKEFINSLKRAGVKVEIVGPVI